MSRKVRVGIVIGLIVAMAVSLAAVLVQDRGNSQAPDPRATVIPANPDPTSTPTPPSPSPQPVAVPTPDLTGDDYERIFREITQFRDWLHQNPQPEAVDIIYHPRCVCRKQTRDSMRFLKEKGFHYENPTTTVTGVDVTDAPDERVRILRASVEAKATRIVNEQGEAVRAVDAVPEQSLEIVLFLDSGVWRVFDIEQQESDA